MRAHPGGPEAAAIEETVAAGERDIYRQHVMALLARGYQQSLELAETAYTMLQLRRLRSTIESDRAANLRYQDRRDHVAALREAQAPAEAIAEAERLIQDSRAAQENRETSAQTWKALGDLQATIRAQVQVLDKRLQASTDNDPERELREAERYVQEHLGEFEHRCPNPDCGMILSIPALPHWAFSHVVTRDGPVDMVWSPELWALVQDRTISLWVMAFVLRTSPEALKLTAERRGELWPVEIELPLEEAVLEVRLRQVDRQALALTTSTQ